MDLQEGERKKQMEEETERFADGHLAECICEHTCRTFAGPMSTLMWNCPQQIPNGMDGPVS